MFDYGKNIEANQIKDFLKWRNCDFSLKKEFLVYKKWPGFKEIPFDLIGLLTKKRRIIIFRLFLEPDCWTGIIGIEYDG